MILTLNLTLKRCHGMYWTCSRIQMTLGMFFKELFFEVVNRHAPMKERKVRSKSAPWINDNILSQIHDKDYHHKKYIKERNPQLWQNYKHARNKLTSTIKSAKADYYATILEENKYNPQNVWKTIKSLLPNKRTISAPNKLKVDNISITDPTLVANTFNEYFTNIGVKLSAHLQSELADTVPTKLTENMFKMPVISTDYILTQLMKMPNGKATGLDGLSVRLLKTGASIIAPFLTNLFNLSLQTGIVPNEFKSAKVTPLYKSGNLEDTNNYRPISVLSVVSKLLEKAVHDALYTFLNKNNILSNLQSGFRKSHSTTTALTKLCDHLLNNINDKQISMALLLIFAKRLTQSSISC